MMGPLFAVSIENSDIFVSFRLLISKKKKIMYKNSIQICMSCTKQTTNPRNEIRELKKSLCAGFEM